VRPIWSVVGQRFGSGGRPEPGVPGRGAVGKVLFAGAVEVEERGFGRARLGEVLDPAAVRIEPGEDVPDGAVLPGRIDTLKHHEQAAAAFRPQPVL